jgi:hypothetical protein
VSNLKTQKAERKIAGIKKIGLSPEFFIIIRYKYAAKLEYPIIGEIQSDHHTLTGDATINIVVAIATKAPTPISRKKSGRKIKTSKTGVHQARANS